MWQRQAGDILWSTISYYSNNQRKSRIYLVKKWRENSNLFWKVCRFCCVPARTLLVPISRSENRWQTKRSKFECTKNTTKHYFLLVQWFPTRMTSVIELDLFEPSNRTRVLLSYNQVQWDKKGWNKLITKFPANQFNSNLVKWLSKMC